MLYKQVSPASSWRQSLNIYNQAGKGSCICSQRPERNWHIHRCVEQRRNKSSRWMKAMNSGGWKWPIQGVKVEAEIRFLEHTVNLLDNNSGWCNVHWAVVWLLQLFTFWTSKGLSAIRAHQLCIFLLEHLIYNIQATYSRTPFSLSCFILGCNLFWRQRSLSRVECSLNLWSAVTRVGTCAGFIIHLLAKFR